MNPTEFASKHLYPYKTKGGEIVPTECPYCRGGEKHDKHTFALSISKLTFNCKRGSCNKTGTFWQLCKDFGEKADSDIAFELKHNEKQYKKPLTKTEKAKKKVCDYLELRGFSKGTWELCDVKEFEGNIAFPYYENNKLVLMKFRKPEKYDGNGRKAWRESGGKGVFWLMDDCTHDLPLVIVEGEYDALAVKESGYKNVVSVPSGNDDLSCVDNCWEWLEKFNEVIIWPDSDEPGQKMMRNLITRLGDWRCSIVKSHCKDANELLFKSGKESVLDAIDNAEIVPTVGLISLADVEPFDKDKVIRVPSSLSAINQVIGGYMMGQVSIWTGTSSSGKSTFLGQELLNAINKGFVVCCFSGELPSQIFQHWCDLQAAGPNNLESEDDDFREETVYYLSQDTTAKIHDWYKEKFYLIDAFGSVKEDLLIKNFEYAARRYDCKMFVVDNLMTMIFSGSESDFYRKQSAFVGRLVEFSHRLNVHVHVVAHPRKVIGKATKMDVSGTAEITNRADNVFSVTRVDEETKAERNENKLYGDTLIDVLKNRFSGRQDVEISMIFDNKSRRFRMTDNRDGFDIKYGWEYA